MAVTIPLSGSLTGSEDNSEEEDNPRGAGEPPPVAAWSPDPRSSQGTTPHKSSVGTHSFLWDLSKQL